MDPAWDDIDTGSVTSKKYKEEFKDLIKNPTWEICFRKYTKIKYDEFSPKKGNEVVIIEDVDTYKKAMWLNHSTEGIAISRNPDFVKNVLGTPGSMVNGEQRKQNVVSIIVIPPEFGIDLEKEYLKAHRERFKDKKEKSDMPKEYYFPEDHAKLSKEVTVQRVPGSLVFGWFQVETTVENHQKESTIKFVKNENFSLPNGVTIGQLENNNGLNSYSLWSLITKVMELAKSKDFKYDGPDPKEAGLLSINLDGHVDDDGSDMFENITGLISEIEQKMRELKNSVCVLQRKRDGLTKPSKHHHTMNRAGHSPHNKNNGRDSAQKTVTYWT